MLLTKYKTSNGSRWAVAGHFLLPSLNLTTLSLGWRVVGNGRPIRIRRESSWNVPEPELLLVINGHREILGYCAGNDVSSRDIGGENPLYLPQAKIYNGSCALGHGILLCEPGMIQNLPIRMEIRRANETIFSGETSTTSRKRMRRELVELLTRELDFPEGVFLMTGTCLVPDNFTLQMAEHFVDEQPWTWSSVRGVPRISDGRRFFYTWFGSSASTLGIDARSAD